MAQIQCIVTEGDSPLQIAWTMQGQTPHSNASASGVNTLRVGERSSLLIIESVTAKDSGLYTCTVSNKGGTASQEAELVVNGTHGPSSSGGSHALPCFARFLFPATPPRSF